MSERSASRWLIWFRLLRLLLDRSRTSPVAPMPEVVIVADPSLIEEPAPSALTPYAPRPVAGDRPPEVATVVIVDPVAEIAPPSPLWANANSRALSRRAPWAGDKGLGRNGIPKPAGAGGGSSSFRATPAARRWQPFAILSTAWREILEQNERS